MLYTIDYYVKRVTDERPYMLDCNEFKTEKKRDEHIAHLFDLHGKERVIVAPSQQYEDTVVAIISKERI